MEFLVVVGLIVFAAVLVLLLSKSARNEVLRPAQDKLVGICNFAVEQSITKQKNKQRILGLLAQDGLS